MAITSNEKKYTKNETRSSCSKSSNLNTFSSMKIDYITNTSLTSNYNKDNKSKINRYVSPYLSEDRVKLLSRVIENRFLHKKNDFKSFPLTVNIYKANSDELRSSKRCKKVKKSVLTLPNDTAPLPQACTVSDMNESEYFNDDKDNSKPKIKKRAVQNNKKSRMRNKETKLYNRDAKYCSQLDIGTDGSSTDMITGDKKVFKKSHISNTITKSNLNAHDIWSVLRKVNQFKFIPSPPISQDSSFLSLKNRKKIKKRRNNLKETRLIETCQTEEFAYISSFLDNSRNSCSQSSFDRVTVIENQDENETLCNNTEKLVKSTIPKAFYSDEKTLNPITSKKTKPKQNYIKPKHAARCSDKLLNDKKPHPLIIFKNDKNLKGRNKSHQNNEVILLNDMENNIDTYYENLNNDINIQNIKCIKSDQYYNSSKKSDSSKGIGRKKLETSAIPDKNISQQQVNGITKVVLSKGQNILRTNQTVALKRNSHLSMTTPINSIMSKMTLTEIRRRLASIRFPLVILGKDQLSSTITVENYDPPQFAGLDEHIWPFMHAWCFEDSYNTIDSIRKTDDKMKNYSQSFNMNKVIKNVDDKVYLNPTVENVITNVQHNTLPLHDKFSKPLTHTKPIHRIKNRMMQFIHNKTIPDNKTYKINYQEQKSVTKVMNRSVVDVGTNTLNSLLILKQKNEKFNNDAKAPKNILPFKCYPKNRAKWTSEFIENIFRKIKNGVYYSQDDDLKKHHNNTKENSTQTEFEYLKNIFPVYSGTTAEDIIITNETDSIVSIPGFDNRISDLEIETLNNSNQVIVKHCITNVVIKFDVTLSSESNRALQVKQSHSCIPVTLVANQPTVFKCKTTIVNAILPAELCSILPKLMEKIIDYKLDFSTCGVDSVDSNLITIPGLTHENNYSNKYLVPIEIDSMSKINVSRGQFSMKTNVFKNFVVEKLILESEQFDLTSVKRLLSTININSFGSISLAFVRHHFERNLCNFLNYDNDCTSKLSTNIISNLKERSTCKTLQLYQYSAKKLIPAHENFSFTRIVETLLSHKDFININTALNPFRVVFYKYNFNIKVGMENKLEICQTKCFIHKLIKNLYNNEIEDSISDDKIAYAPNMNGDYPSKAIIDKIDSSLIPVANKRKSVVEFRTNNIKNKKRGFLKFYKKCKSTSSISTYRSYTCLDKITNLDEFYLALGSGKMLSGVIDGNIERKILSSINDMKNWMTDITSRQALLVLLLANKKDTTNLVRYRPIILQAIAVNRITRSSELDMEIEVIERENMNKLTQYSGITYLPATEENQDNLLEELYWIAKTTASDYQKPFDESSERLLKSLLEKRKKLNPSYLRVMARYVGLGLLKNSK